MLSFEYQRATSPIQTKGPASTIVSMQVLTHQILNAKIFLIQTDQGDLLIDAGIPGFESSIKSAFRRWRADPRQVRYIILTHGHLDHIGCLSYARSITGAKIICHHTVKEHLAAGGFEPAVPRALLWKLFNKPLSLILVSRLKPVDPEIAFEDQLSLEELGFPGRIIHTPGHSPGSCSLILDSREALIGDLIRVNRGGEIDTGLFHSNREMILVSLKRIAAYQPKLIHLSHARAISREELGQFILREART